jgi:hypothetical protein
MWEEQNETSITNLARAIEQLLDIDIDQEIAAHRALDAYNTKRKTINDLTGWIKRCELDEVREQKEIDKLKADIASLENHTCHSCGQGFHDDKQVVLLEKKRKDLQETALQALATNTQWMEHTDALKEFGDRGECPVVVYDNLEQALNHKNTLSGFERDLEIKAAETETGVTSTLGASFLQSQGLDRNKARVGLSKVAEQKTGLEQASRMFGETSTEGLQKELEQENLLGQTSKRTKRLASQARAQFGGQSGVTSGSLGRKAQI